MLYRKRLLRERRSVEIVDDDEIVDEIVKKETKKKFQTKMPARIQRLWRVFCNYALKYQAGDSDSTI